MQFAVVYHVRNSRKKASTALLNNCISIASSPPPLRPPTPRRTLYDSRDSHIEDPSKPEFFREERWGSERQRYAWIDGRMKECTGPMRHPELWCYWEMWSVCVCVHASEILLASLWHSPLSLSCTGLSMENNIRILKEAQSFCSFLVSIDFFPFAQENWSAN